MYCSDPNKIDDHPLIPVNNYNIKLEVNKEYGSPTFSSPSIQVYTSQIPTNGYCEVHDIEDSIALSPFSLDCY